MKSGKNPGGTVDEISGEIPEGIPGKAAKGISEETLEEIPGGVLKGIPGRAGKGIPEENSGKNF